MTDYVIQSGDYTIARYQWQEVWHYNTWHGLVKLHACTDAQEARDAAERHARAVSERRVA